MSCCRPSLPRFSFQVCASPHPPPPPTPPPPPPPPPPALLRNAFPHVALLPREYTFHSTGRLKMSRSPPLTTCCKVPGPIRFFVFFGSTPTFSDGGMSDLSGKAFGCVFISDAFFLNGRCLFPSSLRPAFERNTSLRCPPCFSQKIRYYLSSSSWFFFSRYPAVVRRLFNFLVVDDSIPLLSLPVVPGKFEQCRV